MQVKKSVVEPILVEVVELEKLARTVVFSEEAKRAMALLRKFKKALQAKV